MKGEEEEEEEDKYIKTLFLSASMFFLWGEPAGEQPVLHPNTTSRRPQTRREHLLQVIFTMESSILSPQDTGLL